MKTIFTNAAFHTMEHPEDTRSSMTVEGGRIVGFDETPALYAPHTVQTVDLGGGHVYPSLIDSHMHMFDAIGVESMGFSLCSVVDGCIEPHNLAGAEARIREYAASAPRGGMLLVSNYIAQAMDESRLPTRFELDAWTDGRKVLVLNMDGHSSSCSTALLQQLELAEAAPDGILKGEAHDANLGRITQAISSSIRLPALAQGIARFVNRCAEWGIGCICALEGTDDVPRDRLTELFAFIAARLPLDVRMYPQYMDPAKLLETQKRMGRPRVGGCMKWELDGSVGSSTAAFDAPYRNGAKGSLYFDTADLEAHADVFAEEGMQVSAHAIGERAIDQLLGIFERLYERLDCPRDEHGNFPHRIDHCEFPRADAIGRIVALKPYITVQPGYAWFDKRFLHGYENTLEPHVVAQQIPLRTLAESGVALLGSSDAPVQAPDPYLQMRGMREFYVPQESLSAYDALCTYTVHGGEALGEARGRLRIGYRADFMVHDRNLLALPVEELSGLTARALFLEGRPYRKLPESIACIGTLLAAKPKKL